MENSEPKKNGAAMTTPSSSSSSSNNSTEDDASCSSCRRLLQEVLSRADSRPRALLQSLNAESSSFRMQQSEDGIRVEIPAAAATASSSNRGRQQWSRLQPSNGNDNNIDDSTLDTPSASILEATTTTPQHSSPLVRRETAQLATSAASSNNSSNWSEWLSFSCRPCASTGPEANARAFVMGPSPLSVVVCTNRLSGSLQEMSEILTHELVHVYDVRRLQLDLRDCQNLAYSEVRAAQAAECRNAWYTARCVEQKAVTATQNLFPQAAEKCVQTVMQRAMADNRPFDDDNKSSSKNGAGNR